MDDSATRGDISALTRAVLAGSLDHRAHDRLLSGDIERGRDITALRRFVGLSRARFARILGVTADTLRSWEADRRQPGATARALLRLVALRPRMIADLERP